MVHKRTGEAAWVIVFDYEPKDVFVFTIKRNSWRNFGLVQNLSRQKILFWTIESCLRIFSRQLTNRHEFLKKPEIFHDSWEVKKNHLTTINEPLRILTNDKKYLICISSLKNHQKFVYCEPCLSMKHTQKRYALV